MSENMVNTTVEEVKTEEQVNTTPKTEPEKEQTNDVTPESIPEEPGFWATAFAAGKMVYNAGKTVVKKNKKKAVGVAIGIFALGCAAIGTKYYFDNKRLESEALDRLSSDDDEDISDEDSEVYIDTDISDDVVDTPEDLTDGEIME